MQYSLSHRSITYNICYTFLLGCGLASPVSVASHPNGPALTLRPVGRFCMPNNVCLRCQTPLQPSENALSVPCMRCVWQEVWPSVQDVVKRTLRADQRTACANFVAWIVGLLPELPADVHAALANIVSEPNRWWCKAPKGGFASPTPLRCQVKAAADLWRAWTGRCIL
jgi:hypothetical protein